MWAGRQTSVGVTAVLVVGVLALTSCSSGTPAVVAPTRPAISPTISLPPLPSASASAGPSASTPPAPSALPKPDLSTFYDQTVTWQNCGQADCAKITVPVDYSDPTGPTIELAAARVKATGDKIGTLFVDPGGPGGSAVEYAKAAERIVSEEIRKHYDVVGVDPRGVGLSAPVNCLTDQQTDDLLALDGTPDNPAIETQTVEGSTVVAKGCQKSGGQLYQYMGTVDAARDMDIARAALKDETFNYLGKSYGTMLGATYAQLFPDRVGRMVLDGALPADLDLVQVSKGQADEFEVNLRNFVEDCLTKTDCPLSGTTDEALVQLRAWLTSLDPEPLTSNGRTLNEALATYAVVSYLYFPSSDYPILRSALAAAMIDKDAGPMLAALDARISRGPDGHYIRNSSSAFYAVTCLDRPFNGSVNDVRTYAKEWAVTAPTFGPAIAWGMLPCKDWPVVGDRVARTVAEGSNPILVVSTTHDPATPYAWGQELATTLANGHLLTHEGFGHTAYRRGSDCVNAAVDDYLLSGTVPAEGTVCS